MALAARAGFLAGLIGLTVPASASPLTTLQQAASQCFRNAANASCKDVWTLSHRLKQQAGKADQLRCYTALLGLEAMVAMAEQGDQDPAQQTAAMQETTRECP